MKTPLGRAAAAKGRREPREAHEDSHSHAGSGFGHDSHAPSEHMEEEGEPWLVSYADLMTLLFGFFAMLFTYATFEDGTRKEQYVSVRREVARYFGGSYTNPAKELADKLKFEWGKSPFATDTDIKVVKDGLEITFITNVLFGLGTAELMPGASEPIETLITTILSSGQPARILVEGHTDDKPIHTAQFPSNWELSAARACTIVRMFERRGYPANRVRAVGLGSSIPAFPNSDAQGISIPENQAHNRRVVVKVYVPENVDGEAAPAAPTADPETDTKVDTVDTVDKKDANAGKDAAGKR